MDGKAGALQFNILSMNKSIKSCVIVNGEQPSFFDYNSGVRQGENLSPILFALF